MNITDSPVKGFYESDDFKVLQNNKSIYHLTCSPPSLSPATSETNGINGKIK